jgi:hypothetical protein
MGRCGSKHERLIAEQVRLYGRGSRVPKGRRYRSTTKVCMIADLPSALAAPE